jgi:hypothetical protein
MEYTDEQLQYINYTGSEHTKLLACAGSGKTRCIIARINNLLSNNTYTTDEIIILTFSKFTRDDFINKITLYNSLILPTMVNTIDKFAKQIIDNNNTVDVSLLSFTFMKYLEITDIDILKTNEHLNKIKTIYIDEAQDLNDIQYKIFCYLRNKLNININMIGDPNQNIYQFRESSDKYIINFDALCFNLTNNFRSHLSIVEFSNYLRPYNDNKIIATKPDNACKPCLMFYDNDNVLETEIIEIINMAKENKIDLSEFAILSPTRGRMNGNGKSHGLCFISNILYKANIKFKQFYEESKDETNTDGIKYEPVKNHINILTYMGSKGLEWNYVIIIDADSCLINKNIFDEEKHKHDQYLLYVACSRAIQNMFIYSKYVNRNGNYYFNLNQWFSSIPKQYYIIDARYEKVFNYSKLNFRNMYNTKETKLWKLIDKLKYSDLYDISNILNFQNRNITEYKQIYTKKYTNDATTLFLSKYTEHLFRALNNIKLNNPHNTMIDIENIINGKIIITNAPYIVTEWYAKNKHIMTWALFDTLTNLDPLIKNTINRKFNRQKLFNEHIISINGYYQLYVLGQQKWISLIYKKYLKCNDMQKIRELLFYLIVIKHSIDTQHYFHIQTKGKKYKYILTTYKNMFDELEQYVINNDNNTKNINIEKWGIQSFSSINSDNILWNITCSNDVSLKHSINAIITYLMYTSTNDNCININYLNLMKGEEITYSYNLSSDDIDKIINMVVL